MIKQINSYIPDVVKANLGLKAFSLKIPLLLLSGLFVKDVTDQRCCVRLPFSKIVKNHLGSVYFGALAIGADSCIGFLAFDKIRKSNQKISLVFKSFNAEFLKRAVGPTDFICDEGEKIDKLIAKVLATGARQHKVIKAYAVTNGETVAEFNLELSLKKI